MLKNKIPGHISQSIIEGKAVNFFVNNSADWIQRQHDIGQFYEPEDLALIASYMDSKTRYIDIGANIGNHVIYLQKFVGLKEITVIEPNPWSIEMLKINLKINDIYPIIDTSFLGYGLSNSDSVASISVPQNNLGAARCVSDTSGTIKITTGDALLGDKEFDFMKIDVEGMEIKCLEGLENIIAKSRPTIFIEIDNVNLKPFKDWCTKHNYEAKKMIKHYQENQNFLVVAN